MVAAAGSGGRGSNCGGGGGGSGRQRTGSARGLTLRLLLPLRPACRARLPNAPPPPLRRLTGFIPIVLYLSYMGLAVWCLFLAMGTIGFLSSFLFTYAIFNAAKSVSAPAACWSSCLVLLLHPGNAVVRQGLGLARLCSSEEHTGSPAAAAAGS